MLQGQDQSQSQCEPYINPLTVSVTLAAIIVLILKTGQAVAALAEGDSLSAGRHSSVAMLFGAGALCGMMNVISSASDSCAATPKL